MTHTLLTKDVSDQMYRNAILECEDYLSARSVVTDITRDKVLKAGLTLTPYEGSVESHTLYRSISREKSYAGYTYTTVWSKPKLVHDIIIEVNNTSSLWRATEDPLSLMHRIIENCGYRGADLHKYLGLSTYSILSSTMRTIEFIVPNTAPGPSAVYCVRLVVSTAASQFTVPAWLNCSFGMLREVVQRNLAPAGVTIHADDTSDLLVSCKETEFLPPSAPNGLTRRDFLDLLQGRSGQGDIYVASRDIGLQCRELSMTLGFTPEAFHITPDGYAGPEDFENNPILKLVVMTELQGRNSGYFPASRRNGTYGYGTEKKRDTRLSSLASSGHNPVAAQLSRKKVGSHVETWARVVQKAFPELSKKDVILTCDHVLGRVSKLGSDFQFQVFGGSPGRVRDVLSPFVVRHTSEKEEAAA